MAPEVAPGRVPVHEEDGGAALGALVDVVQPHVARLHETGGVRERAVEVPVEASGSWLRTYSNRIASRPCRPKPQTEQRVGLHGGRLVAKRLKAHGVTKLFTLSGGHLFSIYDGCREEGIDIVDVRHEQTAVFAAEGWAKATREPGVCALTAGPGVTNGMSGMASALQNGSPLLVLGGRAPALRWGQGSLQEIDHVPFVAPLTKLARTAESHGRHPRARGRGAARVHGRADRSHLPRLPARPRVHGGRGGRRRAGRAARSRRGSRGRRRRDRACRRAAALGRAARDHGGHRALLGPRRGGAPRARRGASDPGVPQRPGARLRARRPRRSSSHAPAARA